MSQDVPSYQVDELEHETRLVRARNERLEKAHLEALGLLIQAMKKPLDIEAKVMIATAASVLEGNK